MPRPTRMRQICCYPDHWSFVPEDVNDPETVTLKLDEFEAIRRIDYESLTQEQCASMMGVSRATVAGIYACARFKISDALINGKRIRISGGSYTMESLPTEQHWKEKGEHVMRIAVTYEQGYVGQHFGHTEQFKLYDVENGKVLASQVVDTNGTGHGALAGFLRALHTDVLICGGIGMGARIALDEAGIELLPGVDGIADEVVQSYLTGDLSYDPDTVCHHHDHEHGEGHSCHGGSCSEHSCR